MHQAFNFPSISESIRIFLSPERHSLDAIITVEKDCIPLANKTPSLYGC